MKYRIILSTMVLALAVSSPSNSESLDPIDPIDPINNSQLLPGVVLSDGELDRNRAEGIDIDIDIGALTFNEIDINGSNHGNTAIGTITGDNIITNSSFAGASGLIDVIQNSGNNVLIQKATIVNITIVE